MTPDPWQTTLLRSTSNRQQLLCSRQAGKSTAAAALALLTALLKPPALTLLLSPTLRQSGELFRQKVLPLWRAMGCPGLKRKPTALELELANGSRIVSLPESEEGIRGFSSVALLVIDEASRVSDALYMAVRPMLAVSQGRLIALSTPFGQRGWFFQEWEGLSAWERIRITANQVPRITREFLAEERRTLGDRWYFQEYHCEFVEGIGNVFSSADIHAALSDDVEPLFCGVTL
jgi:Terminase large subunit, T4likevirus-type, N-terminal